jgi:hypothetical protein
MNPRFFDLEQKDKHGHSAVEKQPSAHVEVEDAVNS